MVMERRDNQIPGKIGQTVSLNDAPSRGQNTVWALVRRLKARVDSMELALSTARRDINRIDKKQYREQNSSPPLSIPSKEDNPVSDSLFG